MINKEINRKVRQFSDVNLNFTVNPFTLDINKRFDEDAIKDSVKNLIQTKNYERPFHPEIGCQIFSLLFEPFTDITKNIMRRTIFDVIEKFEPRVTVTDVIIKDDVDDNQINIEIFFKMNNNENPIKLITSIKKIR
jgi:phage baseplate assembly protein W